MKIKNMVIFTFFLFNFVLISIFAMPEGLVGLQFLHLFIDRGQVDPENSESVG